MTKEGDDPTQLTGVKLHLWRLKELRSTKDIIDGGVFVIRGHHLSHFALLAMGKSPNEISYMVQESVLRLDENIGTLVPDVIGYGSKDRFIHRTLTQKVFEAYRKLDARSIIKLSTKKDGICNACKVGNHCLTDSLNLSDYEESLHIAAFATLLKSLNLEDKITIQKHKLAWPEDLVKNTNRTPFTLEVAMSKEVCDKGLDYLLQEHDRNLADFVRRQYGCQLLDNTWYKEFVNTVN